MYLCTQVIFKISVLDWFGWFSWHINRCWLFNTKSCFYIYIICIWFVNSFVDTFLSSLSSSFCKQLNGFKYFYLTQIFLITINHSFAQFIGNDAISSSKKFQKKKDQFWRNCKPKKKKKKKNTHARVSENSRIWENPTEKIKTLGQIFWPIWYTKKYAVTFFVRNLPI